MKHKYAVVSTVGALISSFSGDPCYFTKEIGDNLLIPLEDDIPFDDSVIHVYDFQNERMTTLKKVPYHVFNYETRQWVDTRAIDELKSQKWAEIKLQRDAIEFGGFEFEGGVYDSDQVSQGRIMGAAAAGVDQTWTLADNTTVELSAPQLQQLYAALQAHIAGVHERGRIARQLVFEAETREQVEAVQL